MADIFFSYASEDRARVTPIVAALERRGWSVWWDREIVAGGSFEELIDAAIAEARCVVVAWSKHAVESRWVKNEALEGLERDVLVPILLEPVRIPVAFRQTQAADLTGPLDPAGDALLRLFDGVEAVLGAVLGAVPDVVPSEPEDLPREIRSVAVLPFRDLSRTKDYDWLTDGIADALNGALAAIPGLRVASTTNVAGFRESARPVESVGKALGVANVLEGSVRVAGQQIRITTHLTSTETGFHTWSATLDGHVDEVFDLQDRIAGEVAATMKIALSPEQRAEMSELQMDNLDSFRLWREMQAFRVVDQPRALTLANELIERDPGFVPAYLSKSRLMGSTNGASMGRPVELMRREVLIEGIGRARPGRLKWSMECQLKLEDWAWLDAEQTLREQILADEPYSATPALIHRLEEYCSLLVRAGLPGASDVFYAVWQAEIPSTLSLFAGRLLAGGDWAQITRGCLNMISQQGHHGFYGAVLVLCYTATGQAGLAQEALDAWRRAGADSRFDYYAARVALVQGNREQARQIAESLEPEGWAICTWAHCFSIWAIWTAVWTSGTAASRHVSPTCPRLLFFGGMRQSRLRLNPELARSSGKLDSPRTCGGRSWPAQHNLARPSESKSLTRYRRISGWLAWSRHPEPTSFVRIRTHRRAIVPPTTSPPNPKHRTSGTQSHQKRNGV